MKFPIKTSQHDSTKRHLCNHIVTFTFGDRVFRNIGTKSRWCSKSVVYELNTRTGKVIQEAEPQI